jgi:hypothetical protein
MWLLSSLL